MIEVLKIIGSALVTAAATLCGLYLKRKWDMQDKGDAKKEDFENKVDDMSSKIGDLEERFNTLDAKMDAIVNSLDDNNFKTRCVQAGLKEMLYDRIKYLSHKYIEQGKIREEEYKSLTRMWKVYHEDLEGNGFLDGEMQAINKLEKY